MLSQKQFYRIFCAARIFFIVVSILVIGCPDAYAEESKAEDQAPFAVLEFFTSEGCVNCPPADENFSRVITWAEQNNLRVFSLGFHVDYWDDLGWTDPFGNSDYSYRQKDYADHFESTAVYTPQFIVNGQRIPGMNAKGSIVEVLKKELTKPVSGTLTLSLEKKSTDSVVLRYAVTPDAGHNILNVAVVEKNLTSQVQRAENAGRLLKHDNVVRYFRSGRMKKNEGTLKIPLSSSWKKNDCTLIVYIQDPATKVVTTAAEIPFQEK